MKHLRAIKEIRAFNRFYTNITGVVDRHILDSPFSLTEVRVLYELYHDVNATASAVKRFLQVDEGYLSHTIDKLVSQGLIVKRRSETDGRVFVLLLSEKGKKVFLALNSRSDAAVESMIMHMSSDGVDKLVSMMRSIRGLLSKDQENDGKRPRHPNPKSTRAR